jgi:hypothetical protein
MSLHAPALGMKEGARVFTKDILALGGLALGVLALIGITRWGLKKIGIPLRGKLP